MRKFNGLAELVAAEGTQLGPTQWLEMTQDRVNLRGIVKTYLSANDAPTGTDAWSKQDRP